MLLVKPAEGRNYKSARKAVAAWNAGESFICINALHPSYGRPVDVTQAGGAPVCIRYAPGHAVTIVPVSEERA